MQSVTAKWTVSPPTVEVGISTDATGLSVIGFVIVLCRPLISIAWMDCKSI